MVFLLPATSLRAPIIVPRDLGMCLGRTLVAFAPRGGRMRPPLHQPWARAFCRSAGSADSDQACGLFAVYAGESRGFEPGYVGVMRGFLLTTSPLRPHYRPAKFGICLGGTLVAFAPRGGRMRPPLHKPWAGAFCRSAGVQILIEPADYLRATRGRVGALSQATSE